MNQLFIILCLVIAVWLWFDSRQIHESAVALCRRACQQRGLQMLDQTVALRRLGVAATPAGLRWRRVYRFEFCELDGERRSGYLVMRGAALEELSFGLPAQRADA